MKKLSMLIILMCSINSAAVDDSMNFNTFRRMLRDLSSGARGMLDSACLNKLAHSKELNYDELMITLIGFDNMLDNGAKNKFVISEDMIRHIRVIQKKASAPSDEELQSSLTAFYEWLQARKTALART